uniref:Uncharacterized protein n=2 Tax=Phaeomonas parva TaxID=124430 RepID=A0A7S1UFX7_9STRA|mmetsp:Transcript_44670/g.140073  ORF Transcript_44670/g.140073 Transcript_44670/m.140073 type:complete len:148 (+) Transcript_44670:186-629(+)
MSMESIMEGQSIVTVKPEGARMTPLGVFIMLVCGWICGLAVEKSRVFTPFAIRAQFVFAKWIMLKIFLGACVTSTASFLFLERCLAGRFDEARSLWFLNSSGKSLHHMQEDGDVTRTRNLVRSRRLPDSRPANPNPCFMHLCGARVR